MSFWHRKKTGPLGEPGQPQGDVTPAGNGATGFTPQPEKAKKWFDRAATYASSQVYDGALQSFAEGIRLDPTLMSAHEAMFEAAIQYMNQGGKAATGKEARQLEAGGPIDKFAAAEFAWFKELTNASLALRFLDAAIKSGQLEVGHWAAPKILAILKRQKKLSKSQLLQGKDLFAKVHAWDEAVEAGETARLLDPTDSKIGADLKDLIAQRAMDRAGYAEAAGKEGGFRSFVKDMEKQQGLAESETISAASSIEERNFERAAADYEKSPTVPDIIDRYARLLKKRGRPEDDQQALEVYARGYKDTSEYRFRMAAGDMMIEQASRQANAIRAELEARPDDAGAKSRLQAGLQKLRDLQVAEYTERVSKYPTDRRMKMLLGEVLFELGRFSDAMPHFQAAKEEPRLRIRAGYMLGRAFAAEGWHREAIDEYKEALAKLDASERDIENHVRYDLMESLIAMARDERAVELAREALSICSDIARKDIAFRDIRVRRKEIDLLVKELGSEGGASGG